VAVNYSDHQSQCFVSLPWTDLRGRRWELLEEMGSAAYERVGDDLAARGLYLDMPAWGGQVFEVREKG
jgi:hypothetical protein